MVVKKYAVVDGGVVSNIILWDGMSEYDAPSSLVEIADDSGVIIGSRYENGGFIAPADSRVEIDLTSLKARAIAFLSDPQKVSSVSGSELEMIRRLAEATGV